MSEIITVDDEQARILREAVAGVEVQDRRGNILGFIAPGVSADDVAIARQRMQNLTPESRTQGRTTQELIEYLQTLTAE